MKNFKHNFISVLFFSFLSGIMVANESKKNIDINNYTIYKDPAVKGLGSITTNESSTFHLFSHGKSGELLIQGKWLNQYEIYQFLSSKIRKTNPKIKQINIYGCEFGKGEKGENAVKFLESKLGISIAASDNITGKDGDWNLEVGHPKNVMALYEYFGNLQLNPTNLFSTTTTWTQTSVMCMGQLIHTVQNGTDFIIRSGGLGIDIYTMNPSTGNLTLSQNFLNHAGYVQGAMNIVVLNGVTYLYEENGNIANVYKFSGGSWSLVKEYQYSDINPTAGTNSGYVGGAQTYTVNGTTYIYALTQYAGTAGNQFNRWQINPTTGLIIPSTQQTFSVGGTYIGTEFQIVNTVAGWKLIAATGYNYDNLRIYDMDATGKLIGTYTNIPVTAGSTPIMVTTAMLMQQPFIESNGNLVIAGGDQGGGQIIVYNPYTKSVVSNITTAYVDGPVTYGSDGTNANLLYITSSNSQAGTSSKWPHTAILNTTTNSIISPNGTGIDITAGYVGNPNFSSNNPPIYGPYTCLLVTSTNGTKLYIQQAASCSNNTDGWLAGVQTSLQRATSFVCGAGSIAPVITATTIANSCPSPTSNLTSLTNTGTKPSGTTLVWGMNNPPTSANDTLTSAQASNISTDGTYYAFYRSTTDNCFSPADEVVFTKTCCFGTLSATQYATSATGNGNAAWGDNTGVVGAPNVVSAASDVVTNRFSVYNTTPGVVSFANPILAGDTITMYVAHWSGYTGGYTVSLNGTPSNTGVIATVTSAQLTATTYPYNVIQIVVPATATGSYTSININPNNVGGTSLLLFDAIKVSNSYCYSCSAGATPPAITQTSITNTCPATTYNLTTLTNTGTVPANTTLVWSMHNPPTSANDTLTTAQAAAINANGNYYAFYRSKTDLCFSPADSIRFTANIACCPYGTLTNTQYATGATGNGNAAWGDNVGIVGSPNVVSAASDVVANRFSVYNTTPGMVSFANPILAGDTITMHVAHWSGYTGGYTISLNGTPSNTGVIATVTSAQLTATTYPYNVIKIVVPASATGSYTSINLNPNNVGGTSLLLFDAIKTSTLACNACPAGTNAPSLSSTNKTLCHTQSIKLDTILSSNMPTGSKISWHTGTPATAANVLNIVTISGSSISSSGSVTYYAAFKDTTSSCYSGVNGDGTATTAVTLLLDSDCDGVPNTTDLDDDNDGILDLVECPALNLLTNGSFTNGLTGWSGCLSTSCWELASANGYAANMVMISADNAIGTGYVLKQTVNFSQANVTGGMAHLSFDAGTNNFAWQGASYPIAVNATVKVMLGGAVYATLNNPDYGMTATATASNGASITPSTLSVWSSQTTQPQSQSNLTHFDMYIPVSSLPTSGDLQLMFNSSQYGDDWYFSNFALAAVATTCDTDGDGIQNQFDLDTDGDGCSDAIEGGASFTTSDLVTSSIPGGNTGASYTGTTSLSVTNNLGNTVGNTATTMGVPTIAGTGQTVGTSQNKTLFDAQGNCCTAGNSAPALTPTTASNTCPDTMVNLNTLAQTGTAPTGTTLVWSTHSTPISANDTLTTAQASAISTNGTYYTCYRNPAGCFSPADSVVITITYCCPTITAPTIAGATLQTGTATYVATSVDQNSLTSNGGSVTFTYQKSTDVSGVDPSTFGYSYPTSFTQTFTLTDVIPTDAIATPQPNFIYTYSTSNGGTTGGLTQKRLRMSIDPQTTTTLAKNINWENAGLTSYNDGVFKSIYNNTVSGTAGVGPLTTPAYVANTSTTTTLNGNWVTSLQYKISAGTQSNLPIGFSYPNGTTWKHFNSGSSNGGSPVTTFAKAWSYDGTIQSSAEHSPNESSTSEIVFAVKSSPYVLTGFGITNGIEPYDQTITFTYSEKTVSNTCPDSTVNLNNLVSSTSPANCSLVWFTNNTHTGSSYATPTNATTGEYYAFYVNNTTNCYSLPSAKIIVTITECIDPVSVVAENKTITQNGGIAFSNITSNDSILAGAVILGNGANATVSTFGTWNNNIHLDVNTGAVTVDSGLALGTYPIAYELCDLNNPQNCIVANDTLFVVDYISLLTNFSNCGSSIFTDTTDSWNASWVDYNNDGWEDIYVVDKTTNLANALYKNNGNGTFTKQLNTAISNINALSVNSVWADIDNDGDRDVFIVNATQTKSTLYENLGNGNFAEIISSGISQNPEYFHGAAFADFDRDGYVDLIATNYFETRFTNIYRNNGDKTFSLITSTPVSNVSSRSLAPILADYDNDGFTDIFIPNSNGEANILLRNTGGFNFVKMNIAPVTTDTDNSVAACWGDYDNDGYLDLFVANESNQDNKLYHNNGDGTFTSITTTILTNDAGHSHSCNWMDMDNDGDVDLYVSNDQGENFIYDNLGNGNFYKVVQTLANLPADYSYGNSWADYNKDGALDVFISNRSGQTDKLLCGATTDNNWISIKLQGVVSNYDGIGATVQVYANGVWQTQQVNPVSGFGGSNSIRQHFGFGSETVIDSIRVLWPSGNIQYLDNVNTNQFITIVEEASNTIQGVVFNDVNSNCVKDSNENIVANVGLLLTPNTIWTASLWDGTYEFGVNAGSYTISLSDTTYWNTCSNTLTVTGMNTTNTLNIPLHAKSSVYDLSISAGTTAWRRGFVNQTSIQYENSGNTTAYNVQVTIQYPSYATIIGSDYTYSLGANNTYTFTIDSVVAGQKSIISLIDSVGLSATIGNSYSLPLTISANGTDAYTPNNSYSLYIEVVGAIDPNDIVVTPKGEGAEGYISKDQKLTYTVRFENIGTYYATNIHISNQLDKNLDILTFEIVGASHKYHFLLNEEGHLSINFLKIMLPDNKTNPIGSHGYFTYSIRPKTTVVAGEQIFNDCKIGFDYEDYIRTNTVKNTIKLDYQKNSLELVVFPVPIESELNIALGDEFWKYGRNVYIREFTIYDMLGKVIQTQSIKELQTNAYKIDLASLPAGFYILKCQDSEGNWYDRKIEKK